MSPLPVHIYNSQKLRSNFDKIQYRQVLGNILQFEEAVENRQLMPTKALAVRLCVIA